MKSLKLAIVACVVLMLARPGWGEQATITVSADKIVRQIDEKIYGHFLEHIYHSCNGGLWGEIVWNRSFEEKLGKDSWSLSGGVLQSPAKDLDESRFEFGEIWRDLEVSVEAQRTGASGALLADFHTHDGRYTLVLGSGEDQHLELERNIFNRESRKTEITTVAKSDVHIEQGKWYRVRIRCEGRQTLVWLDDKQVIDVKVESRPERGRVALGVRKCRGQFRNLKVTTLDGRPLVDFLPTPARHWWVVGNTDVILDAENPLNSSLSLKFVSASAGSGVVQQHLSVHKGDACRGSLWVRGEAPDGLVVRLVDGTKTLAENTVVAPGKEWKEFSLELKPDADAGDAALQILARGKAVAWIDQVSLMPDSAKATGGFRPDLTEAVAALKPSVIRWPGGSFVSGYNWKNGIGPQSKRVGKMGWDEHDPLSFGIDEFIEFCRKVKAEPIIVIFVGREKTAEERAKYVQDACEFVEYCNGAATSTWGRVRAENGHPEPYNVKLWEIDNEIWGMKPELYVEIVKQFVPAMKKVDPTIRTIACGSGQLGGHWREGDIAVIEQCADVVDYLSIHHYEGPDKFSSGIQAAEDFWKGLEGRIAKSRNPNLKLFLSEWNAQSTDWCTGLYAGGILNAFERNSVVGMATPALWLRHVSEVSWDNAFINFNHAGWFPAPNYVVMKLYRDNFAPNLLELNGELNGVNAVATRSADGRQVVVKLVNPSEKAVDVKINIKGDFKAGQASMKLVAPDDLKARNTLEEREAVHVTDGKVQLAGNTVKLALPRWSVAVVVITRDK